VRFFLKKRHQIFPESGYQVDSMVTPSNTPTSSKPDPFLGRALTAREKDVLRELASGRTNQETAGTLSISVKTVEAHRARLFKKLGASNAPQAITRAYEQRLLTLSLSVFTADELRAELARRDIVQDGTSADV
jgi:DNA-binding CsgD family transcriptional regulator